PLASSAFTASQSPTRAAAPSASLPAAANAAVAEMVIRIARANGRIDGFRCMRLFLLMPDDREFPLLSHWDLGIAKDPCRGSELDPGLHRRTIRFQPPAPSIPLPQSAGRSLRHRPKSDRLPARRRL